MSQLKGEKRSMQIATTVIYFIIVIGILIFIHELGHFLFAKRLGVGVLKFSLGFGPKLVGKKKGETEYVISAVPLGGYVKMMGDDPSEEAQDPEKSFSEKPLPSRLAIVAAGPGFNFLLAVVLFAVLHMIGIPTLTTRVGEVVPDSPAMQAGILNGDKIIAAEGRKIKDFDDLRKMVMNNAGKTITFKIQRGESVFDVQITPEPMETKNIFGETVQTGVIGVKADEVVTERYNPAMAIFKGAKLTGSVTRLTVVSIVKIIQGKLSPKNIAGPVGIATIVGEQARQGILSVISLTAVLSLSLGVINLVPLPALDGGHILFFAVEAVSRKPFTIRQREVAQQIGIMLLILLMVYVVYNDILRIVEK